MVADAGSEVAASIANLSLLSPALSQQANSVAQTAGSLNVIWEVLNNQWDPQSNPRGYVSLGLAENILMHDTLAKHIHDHLALPTSHLTYNDGPSGSKRLKAALARFLNRHFHPHKPIQPAHLAVTNGVSTAIEHLSFALTDPGDGVLLGRPYYGSFQPDIMLRPHAELVRVSFGAVDPLSVAAVAAYRAALVRFQTDTGRRVRAIVLCHPHNPLGRCYSRDFLIEMMRLCQEYRVHLISDEIYALSTWENRIDVSAASAPAAVPFQSVLAIDPSGIIDPHLVHVLWGMSKDFGANGLRIGTIVSQASPQLHAFLRSVAIYSYPSQIAEHVVANVLEDDAFTDRYLQTNREKLAEAYEFVAGFLKAHDIEYAPGANAAFFVWVDLGKVWRRFRECDASAGVVEEGGITELLMRRLLANKVFLASGDAFGSEKPGWFRIVFSQSREVLEEGLKRILKALQQP